MYWGLVTIIPTFGLISLILEKWGYNSWWTKNSGTGQILVKNSRLTWALNIENLAFDSITEMLQFIFYDKFIKVT